MDSIVGEKVFYRSADIFRIALCLCMIFVKYPVNVPYLLEIQTIVNFAPAGLFAIYGALALKDGDNLNLRIKTVMRTFFIMLAVFLSVLLVEGLFGESHDLFAKFTKRSIFEFVFLNLWFDEFGYSIWMIQSLLYSLIIFAFLKKYKKYDWVLCIVTFIIGFVLGEFAGLINFSFFGYSWIPGNFLTKTIPYLLFGRIIAKNKDKFKKIHSAFLLLIFVLGIAIVIVEKFVLSYLNILAYRGSMLGHIPMTFALIVWMLRTPQMWKYNFLASNASFIFNFGFFVYSPFANVAVWILSLFIKDDDTMKNILQFLGIFTATMMFLIPYTICLIKRKQRRKKAMQSTEYMG